MSGVVIRVDARALFAAATKFRTMATSVPRAIRDGLNEGGDKVRTQVRRALATQMGVKAYRSVTSRTDTVRAGDALLRYVIVGKGKGLPLKEFKAGLTRGAGGGVVATPWGSVHKFKRSFSLGGGDPDQFRARTSSKRFPIRKLYGPSVAKEMLKDNVPRVFLVATQAQVPPVILKRLARALGSAARG